MLIFVFFYLLQCLYCGTVTLTDRIIQEDNKSLTNWTELSSLWVRVVHFFCTCLHANFDRAFVIITEKHDLSPRVSTVSSHSLTPKLQFKLTDPQFPSTLVKTFENNTTFTAFSGHCGRYSSTKTRHHLSKWCLSWWWNLIGREVKCRSLHRWLKIASSRGERAEEKIGEGKSSQKHTDTHAQLTDSRGSLVVLAFRLCFFHSICDKPSQGRGALPSQPLWHLGSTY